MVISPLRLGITVSPHFPPPMKLKNLPLVLLVAVCGSLLPLIHAAQLGDDAAPLAVAEWVKGTPVDVKDGKAIYVVEFWATWCPPCRASIPHLSELQAKLKTKGVVMVGISDETADKVKPFVTEQGAKMDYRVALDQGRQTHKSYMGGFGVGGIPHAFIVNKQGKIVWHGHPMVGLDKALEEILAGTYDMKAAAKKDAVRATLGDYTTAFRTGAANAPELKTRLLALIENDPAQKLDVAFKLVSDDRNPKRDFGFAKELLDQVEAKTGKTPKSIATRGIALFESGQKAEGIALVKAASEKATDEKEKQTYQRYLRSMQSKP
jgi:thiol-disulfide isomerase/thioredoxin